MFGRVIRRNIHSHCGLLQGINRVEDSSFYSNKIDLSLSKQLLMNSSSIYQSAIQDVNEGSGRNIEDYLNNIKLKAKSFIMKKEVYDREEILLNLRAITRDSGNFVCLLGGKSTGKSLIFRHFEDPRNHEKHLSLVNINMRSHAEKRNILEALLEYLADTKTHKSIEIIKTAIEKLIPTLISALHPVIGIDAPVDVGAIKNILKDNKINDTKFLERLLMELSLTCGNLTIIIDEANLAFDPFNSSEEIMNKAKADLQVFTRLTKESSKVRLLLFRYLNFFVYIFVIID